MHKLSTSFGYAEAAAIKRKMKGLIDNGNISMILYTILTGAYQICCLRRGKELMQLLEAWI